MTKTPHFGCHLFCFRHWKRWIDGPYAQRLTAALPTPGRNLPRLENYTKRAGRTAGRLKYLGVDGIIAEGTHQLQKRSISRFRELGVDVRNKLFMLLLLSAIPANHGFAQSSPPPVDERAFDTVSPTVVKRLSVRFSLGAFAGRFEKTTLSAIREAIGVGTIQHQGDAGSGIYSLCYRRGQHRLWVVSGGEIGGPNHLVTEVVEELTDDGTETSADCANIPRWFAPIVFDGKLHLGVSRFEVVTAMGPSSKSEGVQSVYLHYGQLADGFDETAWLVLRFRGEKLVFMRGGKTTTN